MKLSGFAAGACAVAIVAGALPAVAQDPVSCWDYNTLADNVGSRFGLKGTPDDAILSRSAYYSLTKLPAKVSAPLIGGHNSWFKVEFKAEADGADAPLAPSGLLVELDNVEVQQSVSNLKFETHVDADGRLHHLRLAPLEARFRAGESVVAVPFKTQGPDLRRQDIIVRLGAFQPSTWPTGGKPDFDPRATLPVAEEIMAIWKKAGSMTIELALPEGGAVIATSGALPFVGDEVGAEFTRMNGRAREMLSGGKCQYLE